MSKPLIESRLQYWHVVLDDLREELDRFQVEKTVPALDRYRQYLNWCLEALPKADKELVDEV